jgi:hypothetical protein
LILDRAVIEAVKTQAFHQLEQVISSIIIHSFARAISSICILPQTGVLLFCTRTLQLTQRVAISVGDLRCP